MIQALMNHPMVGRAQYEGLLKVLRTAAGATQHHLHVDGMTLPYLRAGRGRPLLLLHGFADAKETWLTLMALLARDHQCFALDLPGFGAAPAVDPAQVRPAAMAQILVAVLDALHLERAHLAGNSLGGAYAAALAGAHPHRVHTATLLGAAGPRGLHPHLEEARLAGRDLLLPSSLEEFDELMRMSFARQRPPLPRPAIRHLATRWMARRVEHSAYFRALEAPEAMDELPATSAVPVLIAYGREEKIVHLDNALAYTNAFRNHKRMWVDGCGHAPQVEQPLATARAIRGWTLQHHN